jgi:ATP-binding protein involved in chromosome partitioning
MIEKEDPRESIIEKRLEGIKKLAIVSAKGGVGKSTVSAMLALLLSERARVGVLDLDAHNPSIPAILGMQELRIGEDRGITPQSFMGLQVLSFAHFSGDRAMPLRGKELSDAVKELLTATTWDVDLLIIDTPPGMGEVTLELLRLFRDAKFLVVTTPSLLARRALEKELEILDRNRIAGIIENLSERDCDFCVRYSEEIERACGDADKLLRLAYDIRDMAEEVWKKL